jgi:hypothetical protein
MFSVHRFFNFMNQGINWVFSVFGAASAPETKKALSESSKSAFVCGRGGIRISRFFIILPLFLLNAFFSGSISGILAQFGAVLCAFFIY